MHKSAKEILNSALKNKYAVPAFNVSSVEALQAIFEGASETDAEVLIETSKGESEHLGPELLVSMCEKLGELHNVNYSLHLDRGNNLEYMKRCLDAGYNSISVEFAEKDFQKNTELSLQARELTNKYDAQMEGVNDVVPLVIYNQHQNQDSDLSDPELLLKFAEIVKPDSLVVSIGTQSGKYKKTENIRWDILEEVHSALPDMPLVLHGGSFLTQDIIDKAIANGISKINVNSELRIAYTNKLKANMQEKPDEYAPYKILVGVKDTVKSVVIEKIKMYGQGGK